MPSQSRKFSVQERRSLLSSRTFRTREAGDVVGRLRYAKPLFSVLSNFFRFEGLGSVTITPCRAVRRCPRHSIGPARGKLLIFGVSCPTGCAFKALPKVEVVATAA